MPTLKSDATTLVLTNRHKVFWPDEGYTKGDLLDYYREIASVILPYLKDRPQSLHRHVDGWQGKEFWQRISRTQPPWVRTARVNNRRGERTWNLTQDWPTLLWLVNFGCIEFLPWCSRVEAFDWPDCDRPRSPGRSLQPGRGSRPGDPSAARQDRCGELLQDFREARPACLRAAWRESIYTITPGLSPISSPCSPSSSSPASRP